MVVLTCYELMILYEIPSKYNDVMSSLNTITMEHFIIFNCVPFMKFECISESYPSWRP